MNNTFYLLKKALLDALEEYFYIQKSRPAFENGHISFWGRKKDIIAIKIEDGVWKVIIKNCKDPKKLKAEIESLDDNNLQNFLEIIGYKLPQQNGEWTGLPGFSKWIPDDDFIPEQKNPHKKSWKEIKSDFHFDGIDFLNGFPDFSKFSECSVVIDNF